MGRELGDQPVVGLVERRRVDPGPLLPEEADETRCRSRAEAPLVAEDHAVPAPARPRGVEQERTRRVREGSPAEPRERGGHLPERGEVLQGPVRMGEGAPGGDLLGAQDLFLVHGVTVAASRGSVKINPTADRRGAPAHPGPPTPPSPPPPSMPRRQRRSPPPP